MGHSHHMQKTFLYRTVQIYNKLPKEITLIKNKILFKKWLKRYNINNNIKLKKQEDHKIEENEHIEVNEEAIEVNEEQCYDARDDDNIVE